METLDCETQASTLDSISRLYGVAPGRVESLLKGFDLEAYLAEFDSVEADAEPFEPYKVAATILDKEPGKRKPLDRVYWFHLTRTLPGNKFKNGLLPLGKAVDQTWETIFEVFADTKHIENLKSLRTAGSSDEPYRHEVDRPYNEGPFAMLVRETAVRTNRSFLERSEFMTEICDRYEARFEISIHKDLTNGLAPCIVKFWSDRRLGRDCIEAAVYYLYLEAHGEKLNDNANTSFDGERRTIPWEQIVCVDFEGALAGWLESRRNTDF